MNINVLWHITPETDEKKLLRIYSTSESAIQKIKTKCFEISVGSGIINKFLGDIVK